MNESQIRSRIRAAIGEPNYQPALRDIVVRRLGRTPARENTPVIGLVAAILALAIVATLVLVRLQSQPRLAPAETPTAQPTVPTAPTTYSSHLPEADLAAMQITGLSDNLVTALHLSATSNGQVVTLIGAYADPGRTVLFFRTITSGGYPYASISDDHGFINAASTAGPGSFGDSYFILEAGPHADAAGVAHLNANLVFHDVGGTGQNGHWNFVFDVPVQPETALTISPALSTVGTWKVTVEGFAATPVFIRFQAVIDGATVDDVSNVSNEPVTLVDGAGNGVRSLGLSAMITTPKSQLGPSTPKQTRIFVAWVRPSSAGEFTLKVTGGGSSYAGSVSIPAPPVVTRPKGVPIAPADYAESNEALTFDGAFITEIGRGNPSQCGFGSGPSGSLFAFATWFQYKSHWYLITFSTDPSRQQYRGPGTYVATSRVYPYASFGADPIFEGTVQLTVASDRSPDTGSVRGTLDWIGATPGTSPLTVSGNWTCAPSPALGPG
jgi:hypothetical protein